MRRNSLSVRKRRLYRIDVSSIVVFRSFRKIISSLVECKCYNVHMNKKLSFFTCSFFLFSINLFALYVFTEKQRFYATHLYADIFQDLHTNYEI